MKLEFSRRFLEKYVNVKFLEIPPIGSPIHFMPNITIQTGIGPLTISFLTILHTKLYSLKNNYLLSKKTLT